MVCIAKRLATESIWRGCHWFRVVDLFSRCGGESAGSSFIGTGVGIKRIYWIWDGGNFDWIKST